MRTIRKVQLSSLLRHSELVERILGKEQLSTDTSTGTVEKHDAYTVNNYIVSDGNKKVYVSSLRSNAKIVYSRF